MPQHKSAIKRVRQSAKRRIANREKRAKMRTLVKKVFAATSKEEAQKVLPEAISYLDRMAKLGLYHKNNIANKKSQLTLFVNKLA